MTEDELLEAIRLRLNQTVGEIREEHNPRPPLTPKEFQLVEERLGQSLPSLLARLYLEIGDGGWGPWAGFCPMGVRGDENEPHLSVISQWNPDSSEGQFLSFCDGGCTIFSVLDLGTGAIGLRDNEILWQAESLHNWLELWLSGKNVMSFTEKL